MWRTSAVLGTLSQKTSILRSPWVVCSVTDMVAVVAVRLRCYWRCIVVCSDLKLGREAGPSSTIRKTAAGVLAQLRHQAKLGVSEAMTTPRFAAALRLHPALQP